VCDFDYSPDWSPSRREHVIRHYEWEHGVRLRRLQEFEAVGEVDGSKALLVRPDSRRFLRRQAERVSRRSIREPLGQGAYDQPVYYAEPPGAVPELHEHAVLLASGGCAVAILVLERRHLIQRYRWTARPRFELAEHLPEPVRWTIAHVWVLPALRGHGLGRGLVRLAAEGVSETPDTIGWLSPFTRSGKRLMASVTSDGFHRACGQEVPPLEEVAPPFPRHRDGGSRESTIGRDPASGSA
jgi:GNAT superfamily N-acetyltransferase